MEEITYGYIIGGDIQVDVRVGVIARIYSSKKLNSYTADAIFIGGTSMKLLTYLLENAGREVIPYSDILHNIWDLRGLVSSYKRLNQVMKELREKLERIGLGSDFILTVRGKGYRINGSHVKRLYSKSMNVNEIGSR